MNIEEIQCVGREIVSLLLRHFYFSQQAEPPEIFYYFFLTRLENDGSCES